MEELLDFEDGENKSKRRGRISVILFLIGFSLMFLSTLLLVLVMENYLVFEPNDFNTIVLIVVVALGNFIGITLGFIGLFYSINAIRQKEVGTIKFLGLSGNTAIILLFFTMFVNFVMEIRELLNH